MAIHSSSSAKFPPITLVVSLDEPLRSSSPILSLIDSTYPLSKVELILVSENRVAFDASLLKKANFKSIRSLVNASKSTFYSQIDRGAGGNIVLFIQGDCRPAGRWIKETVAAFRRDKEIGLVLGEVQWRTSVSTNKVGDYCEQIGLDSAWQALGGETASYLTLKKREDSTDMVIEPIAPLLTPTNLALRRDALALVAKSCHSLDRSLGRQEIEALESKKIRIFYQSLNTIERCPEMTLARLGKMMTERGFRMAAWSRFHHSSVLRFRFQFAGEHEVSTPFLIPVDIAWGDFHWVHLWAGAFVWKILWIFTHPSIAAAGDTDMALFEASMLGFFLFRYFLPVLKVQPWSDFILWCWLRYRSNMSMFWGGIKASVKFRCFQWSESW